MKKSLICLIATAMAGSLLFGCTPLQQSVKKDTGAGSSVKVKTAVSKKSSTGFKPFYIYTEEGSMSNHYCPSGWMGDISDLKIDGTWAVKPHSGRTCFKISYAAKGPNGWAGIYWQEPANNWGTVKGGFNLSGATSFTFWLRGEKGGERIGGFTVGGIMDGSVSSDTAKGSLGAVVCTKEWKQYTIDLTGKDMSNIISGLSFSVGKGDNVGGSTFYLDDVRYE